MFLNASYNAWAYVIGVLILFIWFVAKKTLTWKSLGDFWKLFFGFSVGFTFFVWGLVFIKASLIYSFVADIFWLIFIIAKNKKSSSSSLSVKQNTLKQTKYKAIVFVLLLSIIYIIARGLYLYIFEPKGIHNLDYLVHLNAIQKIFLNNKFSLNLVHVHPLFTVFAYVPFYHLVFGGGLFATLPNAVYANLYLVESVVLFVFVQIIMFILYKYTKNWYASFLASVISLFIFDLDGAYTVYFLIPQTLVSILGFYLLVWVLSKGKAVYTSPKFWLFALLLIPAHLLVGTLWFIIILFTVIFLEAKSNSLVYLTFAFFIGLILGAYLKFFNFIKLFTFIAPSFMEARKGDYITYTFFELINTILLNYSLFVAILLLVGTIYLIFYKNYKYKVASLVLTFVFVLLAGNFLYVHKLFVIFHYLVILIIAIIFKFIFAKNKLKDNKDLVHSTNSFGQVFLKGIVVILVLINGFIGLRTQFVEYSKRESYYNGKYYLVLPFEYNLADSLNKVAFGNNLEKKYIDNNCIFVSNPVTMFFVDGLSLCDSLHGYAAKPLYRQIIYLALKNNNPSALYKIPELSEYKHVYVVFTPRTVEWLKTFSVENLNDFKFGIWTLTQDKWQGIECPRFKGELVIKSQNYCVYRLR